jgi:hypothetical protein
MGEFLRTALSGLPTVATHPLALVGYIVAILSWSMIAWRVKRNKNLLKYLHKLPESKRLKALEIEMGHVAVQGGLSPEQYLRSRIHLFYFLGFAILCLLIVVVFVASTVTGRDGTANVDVSLYESLGPKFVEDSKGQSAAVAVENDEAPDSVIDRCEGNVLKYTYDRVDEGRIQIKPDMPYLLALRQEGVITNFPTCPIPLPNLSLKVVNNTNRTLFISEVAIKIKSSSIINMPMLRVAGDSQKPTKQLYFYNEGWQDLLTPTVEYDVTDTRSCNKVNFANTKYTRQLPTIQDSTSIDISQEILDFESHTPASTRYPDGQFVCVFGRVNYKTTTSPARNMTFRTWVAVQDLPGLSTVPVAIYGVVLEAGKQGYTKWLSVSHEIKPGESDLFLLRVKADRWAQFDLGFSFRTTEGNYLPGNDVLLEIFVPRFIRSDIFLKESFKERVN